MLGVALRVGTQAHGICTFDDFDELVRLKLDTLKSFQVDYDTFPYGKDNSEGSGIYRPQHGTWYYIGLKSWLLEMWTVVPTFLTTEDVVAQIIKKSYEERRPLSLELDDLPGIFPIKVPVFS